MSTDELDGTAGMSGAAALDIVQRSSAVADEHDLRSYGHDLVDSHAVPDEIETFDDISVVPRAQLPRDVLAELLALENDQLIEKARVGAEDRVPVENTRIAPYRTVVKLFTSYAAGGKARGCSGTLIAPDAVLTAAHCVFNSARATPGYAYSITIVPGMYPKDPLPAQGTRYEAPFGTAAGSKIFVPSGYIKNEANKWNRIPYDYAIVRLKRSLGAVGTKSFGVMPSPLHKVARLIGYHGDKEKGLRMHSSRDQVRKVLGNGTFNHYIDMEEGASGSGITGGGGWEDKIFGINSSEVEGSTPYNIATTIVDANLAVITQWAVRPL
jgi:V8-like Glu-specific endopeptidase